MANPREQLALSLKGQKVRIPDLTSIFRNWPQGINAEVHNILHDVEERLESLFPGVPMLEILKAVDLPMLVSCWWPNTSIDRLRILTYLSIWVFVWDDELDTEIGPLATDSSRGQTYRSDTIAYFTHCLSLGNLDLCDEPSSSIIRNFKIIGDSICEEYTEAQRQLLLEQLVFFINCSAKEQQVRLSGKLPTIQEYWQYRMGTSAAGVALAMNEFANGSKEPTISTMMSDAGITKLWNYVVEIIWLINDIVSIKKEMDQNAVDSLIPLIFNDGGSAQAAIDSAVASLLTAVNGFDSMANDLVDQYQSDDITQAAIQRFIDACRYNCTGSLNWSLQTKRYGIHQERCAEGIIFTL